MGSLCCRVDPIGPLDLELVGWGLFDWQDIFGRLCQLPNKTLLRAYSHNVGKNLNNTDIKISSEILKNLKTALVNI